MFFSVRILVLSPMHRRTARTHTPTRAREMSTSRHSLLTNAVSLTIGTVSLALLSARGMGTYLIIAICASALADAQELANNGGHHGGGGGGYYHNYDDDDGSWFVALLFVFFFFLLLGLCFAAWSWGIDDPYHGYAPYDYHSYYNSHYHQPNQQPARVHAERDVYVTSTPQPRRQEMKFV